MPCEALTDVAGAATVRVKIDKGGLDMLKKLILGTAALIVLIVGIILVRTFSYGGEPVGQRVELPDAPAVSAESAGLKAKKLGLPL